VLEPRFTVPGFRYAEISGYPGEPLPGDITAQVVHSDIVPAGSWQCDQPWLDQQFRNIDWGQHGNGSAGAPAWGDAGVIVPWTLWKMYGDRASCSPPPTGPATRR
jgi:hypothetical protein